MGTCVLATGLLGFLQAQDSASVHPKPAPPDQTINFRPAPDSVAARTSNPDRTGLPKIDVPTFVITGAVSIDLAQAEKLSLPDSIGSDVLPLNRRKEMERERGWDPGLELNRPVVRFSTPFVY
jgi:hypothetical protein